MIPDYGAAFLADVYDPEILEALLCLARKNAKSAIVAVSAPGAPGRPMGRCVGAGWRAGVVSITKLESGRTENAGAADRGGVQIGKGSTSGAHRHRAALKASGARSTFSRSESQTRARRPVSIWLIVDELGLLGERDRALIAGMRSSVSARRGKFVALSVFGDGPFIPEILERRGDPAWRFTCTSRTSKRRQTMRRRGTPATLAFVRV